jgi:hypothetical protein
MIKFAQANVFYFSSNKWCFEKLLHVGIKYYFSYINLSLIVLIIIFQFIFIVLININIII